MMQKLTPQGKQALQDLAEQYHTTNEAVLVLLQALVEGNGTMAQFNHPDLGGSGQWMQGGMTMVGDMFNNALKAKVDGLCQELSNLLSAQPFEKPSPPPQEPQTSSIADGSSPLFMAESGSRGLGPWWPTELGSPSASGAQNHIRYAIFPDTRCLAIDVNGTITVYDTQDHQINGISQQQSSGASLTLTSQNGVVSVDQLAVVFSNDTQQSPPSVAPSLSVSLNDTQQSSAVAPSLSVSSEDLDSRLPEKTEVPPKPSVSSSTDQSTSMAPSLDSLQEADIFTMIEKLADLHKKGILTDGEFTNKKTELLSRL